MKYRNLKTGAETNQFSEADWKTGVPQRAGWVLIGKEPKTIPKEVIDFVFKKKVIEPENFIAEVESVKDQLGKQPKAVEKKQSKPKQNDNPKPKRTPRKRNA